MMKVKKMLALVLTSMMTLSILPATVLAAGMEDGQSSLTVNSNKVGFAGRKWWVIGDGTSGVHPQSGHITLLAANLDDDFKNIAFRSGQRYPDDDYKKYENPVPGSPFYSYAKNPQKTDTGMYQNMMEWDTPNEYAGSTLQQKMVTLANAIPAKEQLVIIERDFSENSETSGIIGQGITDQKLWALSELEWTTIGDSTARHFDVYWWLRSPYPYDGSTALWGPLSDNYTLFRTSTDMKGAARPALSLDLSSVMFTSDLSATSGKSSAITGNNLIATEATTGTVKFTMKDTTNQTLTVNATAAQSKQSGSTLSFSYAGATTGTNQYVSCVLADNMDQSVKYYGKLADSSTIASENLSVPLTGVADGTYTLKIFSEEANDNLYTDFCSEPVTMIVAVSNGSGKVSNFGGAVLHEHSWGTSAWNHDDTYHWHECTAANCPITDNSQKDGYAEHIYDQEVASDTFLKSVAVCETPAVYYKSCVCGAFSTSAETFTNGEAMGHTAQRVQAKEPTATVAGNIEYWYCAKCDTYFSDEALTKKIQKKDTVRPAKGTAASKTGETTSKAPQTGDSSHMTLWLAMMLVSSGAVIGGLFIRKRRKVNR